LKDLTLRKVDLGYRLPGPARVCGTSTGRPVHEGDHALPSLKLDMCVRLYHQLNALCAGIPAGSRTMSEEEMLELQLQLPDVVAMQTRQANLEGTGEILLRPLVKEALRSGAGRRPTTE